MKPTKQTIERHPLLTAVLAGDSAVRQVEIVQIDLAPSQEAGLHSHPVPVVGYVVAGSIQFQADGEKAKTLEPGDAFYEPADMHVLHFDNASDKEPARFIAFYLLGNAGDELIEML
jgi:quercetin dioxygenase-like cupin family protein